MKIERLAPKAAISLQDFLDRADRSLVPDDPENVWGFRNALAALALNLDWLFDAMISTVAARRRHVLNAYQPSYFIIHRCPKFTLRANVWLPERANAAVAQLENAAFSYDFPHDHNFDILSVTCLGGGYETDLYRYREDNSGLEIGDIVEVDFVGRLHQKALTAFYYEKFKDIHTQLPPPDVVITLNLLPHAKSDNARHQFLFENLSRTSLRVIGRPSSPEGRELSAIRFLGKVQSIVGKQDDRLMTALGGLAGTHKNPSVAKAAVRMLEAIGSPERMAHHLAQEIEARRANIKYYQVAEKAREWRANG